MDFVSYFLLAAVSLQHMIHLSIYAICCLLLFQEPSGGNGGETPAPPHGIFLLSQENVTEASAETADILYQSSSNTNRGGGTDTSNGIDPLLKWRGAIVTLAHLMPQLTGSAPPSW